MRLRVVCLSIVALLFGVVTLAAKERGGPKRRARPPKWSADVKDTFFEDARTKLVGTRPQYEKATASIAAASDTDSTTTTTDAPTGSGWSKLIAAEVIETEIKRLAQAVAKDVTTPSEFKGGTYKDCRRHFSVLAALFAVVGEYDGEARWQDAAPSLRDLFSRAGRNCKVGTDQTFQEATQRKQDLGDLVGGSRPQTSPVERIADWAQVADRPPLMQRMNIAHEERLTKWLANQGEFTQHRDEIRHEAQLVAAIANVVAREGFEFWDDEQFAQYAQGLRQSATDVAAAVELDNFQQAQQAGSQMTKACANCHEGYRG